MTRLFAAALHWQSRAVLRRHLAVYMRKWYTAALPPLFEPLILLLAFGLGLGNYIDHLTWRGGDIPYLTYLAPGMLAYTAFMTAFVQALFMAFIRMRYQKTWEGQLTTQVRLEHVIWGEVLWAATLAMAYTLIVALVLAGFSAGGWIALHWAWLPLALPVLFLAALAFASVGLFFTAIVPNIDHMNLPFFLVILPLGFASSTYFPLESNHPLPVVWNAINPLHHVAEGVRLLLVAGRVSHHLTAAAALCLATLLVLIPADQRLLRRRVLGDGV